MKNKKGFAPIIILWIVLATAGLLLLGGGITSWKINNLIESTPSWVWYLTIFVIILLLLRKKK